MQSGQGVLTFYNYRKMKRSEIVILERGDVVLWNGHPRMVHVGPADTDTPERHGLTFLKKQQSQYRTPWTCYCLWDVEQNATRLPDPWPLFKRLRLLREEVKRIESWGMNYQEELDREIKELQRISQLRGITRFSFKSKCAVIGGRK